MRGRAEEADLEVLLTKLIREWDDCVPSALANTLTVLLEVIDKMYFSASVYRNLVTRPDAEAGIIVRSKLHNTFACSGVGLLI